MGLVLVFWVEPGVVELDNRLGASVRLGWVRGVLVLTMCIGMQARLCGLVWWMCRCKLKVSS